MHAVNNITNIINTSIAGGIHFQHINMTGSRDISTMGAYAARRQGWLAVAICPDAIQSRGNDTGGCCFTNSTQSS